MTLAQIGTTMSGSLVSLLRYHSLSHDSQTGTHFRTATFVEAPDVIPEVVNPSPAWDQLCPIYAALPEELQ
jgi:hypothetical protein